MDLPFQPIGIGEETDVNCSISLQEVIAHEVAGRIPDHLERTSLDLKVGVAFADALGFGRKKQAAPSSWQRWRMFFHGKGSFQSVS